MSEKKDGQNLTSPEKGTQKGKYKNKEIEKLKIHRNREIV